MKLILAIIFSTISIGSISIKETEILGKYIQEVNIEFVTYYKSTYLIKSKNKFEREVIHNTTEKYKGTWFIKDSLLFLTPNNPLKYPTDTCKINKDYLLFETIGKHIKK